MSEVKSENAQPPDDGRSAADPLFTEGPDSLPVGAAEKGVAPSAAPPPPPLPSDASPEMSAVATEEAGSVGPAGLDAGMEPGAAVGQGNWGSATEEIKSAQARHSELLEAVAGSLVEAQDRLAALENGQALVSRDLGEIQRQLQDLTAEGPVRSPRSLINDVFRLYDLAVAVGSNFDDRQMIPVEEFKQRISLIAVQIAQVLQLNGLELIEPRVGEAFNARLHMARQGVPCDDPLRHRTIAVVHQPGFRSESFVYRPAAVDVWMCEEATRKEESAPGVGSAPAETDSAAAAPPAEVPPAKKGEAVEPPAGLAKRPAEENSEGPCGTAGPAPPEEINPEE